MLPTILAAAGADPLVTDGRDLAALLDGEPAAVDAVSETMLRVHGGTDLRKLSLTDGRWKLVSRPDLAPEQDVPALFEALFAAYEDQVGGVLPPAARRAAAEVFALERAGLAETTRPDGDVERMLQALGY